MIEIAAGVTVNLYLLAALGTGVGLIAGFVGVSGGYLLTPILIVMGMPLELAVGTGAALMTANNLIAAIRHRELGHIDLKMGLITAAGTMIGAEFGVRLLHALRAAGGSVAELVALGTLLLTLVLVGVSMVREVIQSSICLANGGDGQSAADEGEVRACNFLQGLSIFRTSASPSPSCVSGLVVLGASMGSVCSPASRCRFHALPRADLSSGSPQ